MVRFFLALLALLAGLGVSGAPAQARRGGGVDTEIGALTAFSARQQRAAPAASRPSMAEHLAPRRTVLPRAFFPSPRLVAPVLPGVDRAHE